MGSEILTYLRLGLHHIADLRGADHILFIAALTVSYPLAEWRRLLWLVTAFTLGHSVTLGLATLSVVRVRASVVEPGIAITIVLSSLMAFVLASREQGTRLTGQPLRYTLAATFGLIHGLGFSAFLRSLLGSEESIVVPLFSFNVGLELGQLLIVAAVLLLGFLAQRMLTRRTWVMAVSGGIGAAGLVMLVQRIR
jgi:HupE/UreJ protein